MKKLMAISLLVCAVIGLLVMSNKRNVQAPLEGTTEVSSAKAATEMSQVFPYQSHTTQVTEAASKEKITTFQVSPQVAFNDRPVTTRPTTNGAAQLLASERHERRIKLQKELGIPIPEVSTNSPLPRPSLEAVQQ